MFEAATISGGMVELIQRYCTQHQLTVPIQCTKYTINDRLPQRTFQDMLSCIQSQQPTVSGLGLQIGAMAQTRDTGVIGYLSSSCETLWEMMLRFTRYNRLAYDVNDMSIDYHDDMIEISWDVDRIRPTLIHDETMLALFLTLMRRIVDDPNLSFARVHFLHQRPANSLQRVYEQFFGCPVQFGDTHTRICLPISVLNMPLSYSDPALKNILERQAEALLQALPVLDHFHEELRKTLISTLHGGEPTLEIIANRMHLSVRTLQRRLTERDLTFQTVLSRTRQTLAEQYLQDDSLTLADIALLLGYSEQSAFQRAFKQWTGSTPHQIRRQPASAASEETDPVPDAVPPSSVATGSVLTSPVATGIPLS